MTGPSSRTARPTSTIELLDLDQTLSTITEPWRPQIVARLNGQEVKVAKIHGEFVWHHHDNEDELFLCLSGSFRLEFRDKVIPVEPGQLVVVPRGVEHRPVADEECSILLFEPAGVVNTGNVEHSTLTQR